MDCEALKEAVTSFSTHANLLLTLISGVIPNCLCNKSFPVPIVLTVVYIWICRRDSNQLVV